MSELILPAVGIDTLPAYAPADIFEADPSEVPVVAPPYYNPFGILKHGWTGTDGSEWDLSDPSKGIFIVQEALEGMHTPLTDEINRESPSVPGSNFQGYRIKARDVIWAIYIYNDESSEAFYDLDRRFWDSVKIGKYGTWRVTRPDGQFRELSMRQVPVSFSHERDPGRFGWVKYPIRFLADENPFWTYPYEVPGSQSTFEDEPGLNFFGGSAGKGPSFYVTPTSSVTIREIYNDGDENVPPVIEFNGPLDFVDFSIGERHYHLECDLEAGQWITINTTPHKFAITDYTGANRMQSIDNWTFDPLPSKETTKVSVLPQGLGGGSVVFDVAPLYHRAW